MPTSRLALFKFYQPPPDKEPLLPSTTPCSRGRQPYFHNPFVYEVGAPATSASAQVPDPRHFDTSELDVSFLCRDAKGEHDTGEPVSWHNCITIKSRTYQRGHEQMVELLAAPAASLRYTTDGSNPKLCGAAYDGPFVVPPGTRLVLAVAEKHGIVSELHQIELHDVPGPTLEPHKPATWKREHRLATTRDSYAFLARLRKYQAVVLGTHVSIVGGGHWLEFTCDDRLALDADALEEMINQCRGLLREGEVTVEALALRFLTGQHLLDWVEEVRTELQSDEVERSEEGEH